MAFTSSCFIALIVLRFTKHAVQQFLSLSQKTFKLLKIYTFFPQDAFVYETAFISFSSFSSSAIRSLTALSLRATVNAIFLSIASFFAFSSAKTASCISKLQIIENSIQLTIMLPDCEKRQRGVNLSKMRNSGSDIEQNEHNIGFIAEDSHSLGLSQSQSSDDRSISFVPSYSNSTPYFSLVSERIESMSDMSDWSVDNQVHTFKRSSPSSIIEDIEDQQMGNRLSKRKLTESMKVLTIKHCGYKLRSKGPPSSGSSAEQYQNLIEVMELKPPRNFSKKPSSDIK